MWEGTKMVERVRMFRMGRMRALFVAWAVTVRGEREHIEDADWGGGRGGTMEGEEGRGMVRDEG